MTGSKYYLPIGFLLNYNLVNAQQVHYGHCSFADFKSIINFCFRPVFCAPLTLRKTSFCTRGQVGRVQLYRCTGTRLKIFKRQIDYRQTLSFVYLPCTCILRSILGAHTVFCRRTSADSCNECNNE